MEVFLGKLLDKLLDKLFKGGKNNQDKHVFVIAVGLLMAVILAITLIGKENISVGFQKFSTNITASNPLAVVLLILTCILAVLYIVAGLLELNESSEKFKQYIPKPPQGAWLLNIVVCILVTLLMYTSITNILQYCIIYLVLIFIDIYFRYAIANSVNIAIQVVLNAISKKRVSSNHKSIEDQAKYKMLMELYVYHKRYPFISIAFVRILLVTVSIGYVLIGKYTNSLTCYSFAYISMIYCLIINEAFSWGYRLKLLVSLRNND